MEAEPTLPTLGKFINHFSKGKSIPLAANDFLNPQQRKKKKHEEGNNLFRYL